MKLKKIKKFFKDKLISKIPYYDAKIVVNEDDGMLELVEPNKEKLPEGEIDISKQNDVEDIIVYNKEGK